MGLSYHKQSGRGSHWLGFDPQARIFRAGLGSKTKAGDQPEIWVFFVVQRRLGSPELSSGILDLGGGLKAKASYRRSRSKIALTMLDGE